MKFEDFLLMCLLSKLAQCSLNKAAKGGFIGALLCPSFSKIKPSRKPRWARISSFAGVGAGTGNGGDAVWA